MLKALCLPAVGKRATLGIVAFVILLAGFFILGSERVLAEQAIVAPEASGPIGLPTPHLLRVLEQSPGPNREGAADASRFTGTVKIGGATAATRSALQIAKLDLVISNEGALTEILRLTRQDRNTWRFGMTADQGLYLYPANQVSAQNPDFHIANNNGTPFATFSPDTGNIGIGTTDPAGKLHINSNLDAGPNSSTDGAAVVIGTSNGTHLELDDNELHAMNGASASVLHLNANGGQVTFNNDGGDNKAAINNGDLQLGKWNFDQQGTRLIIDNSDNAVSDVNFANNDVSGVNLLQINDPGANEGILWSGTGAKIYVAPTAGGNDDGALRLINDGGITLEGGSEGRADMTVAADGKVTIPNAAITGSFNALNGITFPADASDSARMFSSVSGSQTSLVVDLADDSNDTITLQTRGWQDGAKGPINLIGGNIVAEIENVNTRGFNIRNSSGTSLFYARNDGNVGIGTTDIGRRLDVSFSENNASETDPRNINGIRITNANNTVGTYSALTFASNGTASGIGSRRVSDDSQDLFFFSEGGSFEKVTFKQDGSVGIGTIDPSLSGKVRGRFTINSADDSTQLALGVGGIPRFALNTNTDKSWTMYDYAANGWTPGITQKSGSIGIGTTNPGYKLQIAGGSISIDQNQALRAQGNWLIGQSTSNNLISIGSINVANDIRFDSNTAAGLMTVKADGNVLIGKGYSGGGITLGKDGTLQVGKDIILKGGLYKENLQELNVGSNTIILNAGGSAQDAFIKVNNTDGQMKWNQGKTRWEVSPNLTIGNKTAIETSSFFNADYKLNVGGALRAAQYIWNGGVNWNMVDNSAEYSFDFANGDGNSFWHVWDPTHSSILAVRNNGNVGIGTSSPGRKLEVYGGAGDTFVHVDSDDGYKSGIEFAEQGFNSANTNKVFRWGVKQYYDGSDDVFHIDPMRNTNQGTGLRMDGDGRVGIKSNPYWNADLNVAGNGRILGNALYFAGSGWASDNLPYARLIESYGMRFNSPDDRWVFSSNPSILVGYQPDGRHWGWGDLLVSGNVGVGTTGPGAKLEVNAGTGRSTLGSPGLRINTPVQDSTNQDAIYLFENGANASGKQSISWYNGNSNYYKARIWTEVGGGYQATTFGIDTADDARNVATRLAIRNGNVGIGTTTPNAKMYVAGGSYANNAGNSNQSAYAFGAQSIASDASIYSYGPICAGNGWGNCGSGSGVTISPTTTIGSPNVAISGSGTSYFNAGSVGIGTTDPAERFHVSGTANRLGVGIFERVLSSTTNVQSVLELNVKTSGTAADSLGPVMAFTITDSANSARNPVGYVGTVRDVVNSSSPSSTNYLNSGSLIFGTYNFGSPSEKMRVTPKGNVGIGTTSPSGKLTVKGWGPGGTIRVQPDTNGSETAIGFKENTDGTGKEWVMGQNSWGAGIGNFAIGIGGAGTYGWGVIYVTQGGQVGIRTASPCSGCALDVQGGNVNVGYLGNNFATLSPKEKLAFATDRIGLDVAELFETREEVEAGDVLVMSREERKLKKSSTPYEGTIIGVVSGSPALVFEGSNLKLGAQPDRFEKGNKPPVALAGRIPVKVSLENGFIRVGDYLTSSSKPGVAMKATKPGMTIGVALENFDGTKEDAILVFLNIGVKNVEALLKELQQRDKELLRRIEALEKK